MAKKHKVWARQARARLLLKLGNKCAECQATSNLEFDCIHPCGDKHHRGSTCQRMSFYHRQHREGNLQILCRPCNSKKSVSDALILQMQNAQEVECSDYPF